MRAILQIPDCQEFAGMFAALKTLFAKDKDLQPFAAYLEEHYTNNVSSWAYCYRLHAGLNTNMHIERMHRSIKYIYLKGKTSKRLDKAIGALMAFIRDTLFNKLISSTKGKLSAKVAEIRKSHTLSKTIPMDVCKVEDSSWEVKEKSQKYLVQRKNVDCSCQLICTDCNICLHQSLSTCYTSSIKWVMCKHMHYVQQTFASEETDMNLVKRNKSNIIDAILPSVVINQNPSTDLDHEVKKIWSKMSSIMSTVTSTQQTDVILKGLDKIKTNLMVLNSERSEETMRVITKSKKRKISPQRRLFSTKKKTLRKEEKVLPTGSETVAIKNDLVLSLL